MKKFGNFVGVALILIGIIFLLYKPVNQLLINRLSSSVIETIGATEERSKADYNFENVEELTVSSLLNMPKADSLHAIGVISIPDVEMELPILRGVSNENLMAGAGTMKENQVIGEGNYALAGHNWRDRSTLFSPLHRVEKGMRVFVSEGDKEYEYQIDNIMMVDPTRVDIIEDTDEPLLTLVTCNYDGTERLIVQASLISE